MHDHRWVIVQSLSTFEKYLCEQPKVMRLTVLAVITVTERSAKKNSWSSECDIKAVKSLFPYIYGESLNAPESRSGPTGFRLRGWGGGGN